jgi:hypothetical protein
MNIQELRELIQSFNEQPLSEWLFEAESWLDENQVNYRQIKSDFHSAKFHHSNSMGQNKAVNIVSFLKQVLKKAHTQETANIIAPVVNNAIEKLDSPAKHLQDAFDLLAVSKYNSAIACAMNAAESALANAIGRNNQGKITFGEALDRLQKTDKAVPDDIFNAMKKLWNFSNTSSTRHGKEEYDEQTHREATFILGVCASFVGFYRRMPIWNINKLIGNQNGMMNG